MRAEFAVLGFGPAGATVAALQARAGRDVVVVDRRTEPLDAVGESLLPWCGRVLGRLGADMGGFIRKPGAVFTRGHAAVRFDFGQALRADFDHAWEVPRDVFDARLRRCALDAGARPLWATVERVALDEPARVLTDQGEITAGFVVDTLGRGKLLARQAGAVERHAVLRNAALATHFSGVSHPLPAREGDITICTFPDAGPPEGWFWFIPFADGRTSVGLVMTPRFDGRGDRWAAGLARCPEAARRLAGAECLHELRGLQDFTAYAQAFWGPNWALAGDAALFLDPVFSSGVLLGLESAARLADALLAGGDLATWEAEVREAARPVEQAILAFYDGSFLDLALSPPDLQVPRIRQAITSLLAGDVFGAEARYVHQTAGRIGAFAERVRGLSAQAT